jgi:hypothetical protein
MNFLSVVDGVTEGTLDTGFNKGTHCTTQTCEKFWLSLNARVILRYMVDTMSPKEWGPKRERQYEHVKESEEERGKPEKTAKRIAAATVNKTRREKGETKEQKKE